MKNRSFGRIVLYAVIALAGLFLLMQLVPYGRAHANPAVVQEPTWDNTQTKELAQRACYDCHSNETVWPWYSNIAPVSWLVQHDVDEGREYLNFSDWGKGREGEESEEVGEVLSEGEMPPTQFLLMHPEAKLTPAEREQLAKGLVATTGGVWTGSFEGGEGREGDQD